MTYREIKAMDRKIRELSAYCEVLNARLHDITPKISDMPSSGSSSDKPDRIGYYVAQKAAAEEKIKAIREQREKEIARLPQQSCVADCIRLRLKHGYSWNKIAMRIGGNNSSDSVRMMCLRFSW
ncbi:MAG: hypothetical protein LUF33_08450 [Clostridiales bacterium]|nr:hypothetical protein [Clostridiales bacterium]